jgi:hypothetical protein
MNNGKNLSTSELAQALNIDFSESTFVSLNNGIIDKLSRHINSRGDFTTYQREKWDNPLFWGINDSADKQSQYFAIGNSLNFRFWTISQHKIIHLKGQKRGSEFKGSNYMWRCLRICIETSQYPLLDATFLANFTEGQFDNIFSSDTGENPLRIGKEDRLNNLRDLGSKLLSEWHGSFYNVITTAGDSLVDFCRFSKNFIAFDDPLYKLTMVNAILHLGSGLAKFNDQPLPGIDYQLLKQLLRLGVLLPNDKLSEKIKNQVILNEHEAYELRRMALKSFAIISEKTGISGEILDNKFWWNRIKCQDEEPVCVNPLTAAECPFYGVCSRQLGFTIPLEITRYY